MGRSASADTVGVSLQGWEAGAAYQYRPRSGWKEQKVPFVTVPEAASPRPSCGWTGLS